MSRALASARPPIALLTLGGTISMTAGYPGEGAVPSLGPQEVISQAPALEDQAEIRAESFRALPGPHLTLCDIVALARRLQECLDAGAAGAVVVQGTDTMEETAYALDRLVGGEAPIIVTGAMRHASMAGPDGPANLLAAVSTARSAEARGLGCLVVMDGEVHAARFVRKVDSTRVGAFASVPGPLGYVREGCPIVLTRPAMKRGIISLPQRATFPAVAHVCATMGDSGCLVTAAVEAECAGMVVGGLGGGHVSPAFADELGKAAHHIPVVLASRMERGKVLRQTYGYVGGEIDLRRRGVISAGWLTSAKAHILLSLLLAAGVPDDAIREEFRKCDGG